MHIHACVGLMLMHACGRAVLPANVLYSQYQLPWSLLAPLDACRVVAAAGHGGASWLEDAHVHQVYDAIAPHFSSTRFAIWPKCAAYPVHAVPLSI